MAKLRSYLVSWVQATAADVVGYKIYYAPSVDGVDYNSPNVQVGNVGQVMIPDETPGFPTVDGTFEIGIAAVDDVGNESDLTVVQAPLDLVAPDAPTNLVVEAQ